MTSLEDVVIALEDFMRSEEARRLISRTLSDRILGFFCFFATLFLMRENLQIGAFLASFVLKLFEKGKVSLYNCCLQNLAFQSGDTQGEVGGKGLNA